MGGERLHVPHLLDTELCDALRKLVLRGRLTPAGAATGLTAWARPGVWRHPSVPLMGRIWELRNGRWNGG
jgi:predicted nucleic acid-binding protein